MTNIHEGSFLSEMGDEERASNAGWPERYRPQNLDQMALDPSVRRQIAAYLQSDLPPDHLILHGPPGSGKTSVAEIFAHKFFPENHHEHVVRVSASATRSVEHVRRVMSWASARGGLWRILGDDWHGMAMFSEADGLTPEGQDALKDGMEIYAATAVFLFTTNRLENLNEAVRSRCQKIEMLPPPLEERIRILTSVLAREGIAAAPWAVVQFADANEDMRELLRGAQNSVAMYGDLRMPDGVARFAGSLWPIPVDGVLLLDAIAAVLNRYISLPAGAATALALWTVYTHAHEAFGQSSILAVVSPVKRSGKTRLFEVMSQLTPNSIFASNITPAAIYRLGGPVPDEQKDRPSAYAPPAFTLFADEADASLRMRQELESILNSGHTRRAAFVLRAVGDVTRRFSTWFPKAVALIDKSNNAFPTTTRDRSIVIPMRRRRSDEMLAALRFDQESEELTALRKQAARFAHDNFAALMEATPDTPERIEDRAADIWRPLLAVADAAGGLWPAHARTACLILSGVGEEIGELGLMLAKDIIGIFASDPTDHPDRLPTRVLIVALRSIDDHPWATLIPYQLALHLKPFGIGPKPLWDKDKMARGYFLKDFDEVRSRYLGGTR